MLLKPTLAVLEHHGAAGASAAAGAPQRRARPAIMQSQMDAGDERAPACRLPDRARGPHDQARRGTGAEEQRTARTERPGAAARPDRGVEGAASLPIRREPV